MYGIDLGWKFGAYAFTQKGWEAIAVCGRGMVPICGYMLKFYQNLLGFWKGAGPGLCCIWLRYYG